MDNQIKQEIKQDDNWNQVEITAEDIYEDGSDNDLEDDETYEINIELIKNYTYVFYSGILVLKQRILLFFFLNKFVPSYPIGQKNALFESRLNYFDTFQIKNKSKPIGK